MQLVCAVVFSVGIVRDITVTGALFVLLLFIAWLIKEWRGA